MALNYAQRWEPGLIAILNQQTLTSPFITSNVKWLNAKSFHFTQMSVSGYKKHSREGGFKQGKYTQSDKVYTLEHDRDIEFFVDKADVDETNQTASAENISAVFQRTQVAPETDALFFSKVATAAVTASLSSTTALADYNVDNVFTKLKEILKRGKLRLYKQTSGLVMYVKSDIMDLLERSKELTKKVEITQIADGGLGIQTRVTHIDNVPIIEVIDTDRFYSAFNFDSENGGYTPATGAKAINVLVACTATCFTVPKINSIYFFAPGEHTNGDGYLYQNRSLMDTFVFPNGLDGKVDSIAVDLDGTAAAAA